MTTVVAWLSVDSKLSRSLIVASDSRYSWEEGRSGKWDSGRKVFYLECFNDVFAFAGDVTFGITMITNASSIFTAGVNDPAFATFKQRTEYFRRLVSTAHATYPSEGKGSPRKIIERTVFTHVNYSVSVFNYSNVIFKDNWKGVPVEIPKDLQRSQFIKVVGTGRAAFRNELYRHQKINGSFYARHAWRSLAAVAGDDKLDQQTGGPLQAIVLHSDNSHLKVGSFERQAYFLFGCEIRDPKQYEQLEWRDPAYNWIDPRSSKPKGTNPV